MLVYVCENRYYLVKWNIGGISYISTGRYVTSIQFDNCFGGQSSFGINMDQLVENMVSMICQDKSRIMAHKVCAKT